MAQKCFPARPTFGSNKQSMYASDYTYKKKVISTFCDPEKRCNKKNLSQGELIMLDDAKLFTKCHPAFDTSNLNINLFTKLDLTDVSVIKDSTNNDCPTNIVYSEIPNFYVRYVIDPSGQLFGNTPCGTDNYLNYLIYNPPPLP
jgi:hypothetical protein